MLSPKFELYYTKIEPLDLQSLEKDALLSIDDVNNQYKPFHITKFQNYNPVYSRFFELTSKNYNRITLNHRYHIKTLFQVLDTETNETIYRDVFVKYSPLLDPIKYMTGKYEKYGGLLHTLPSSSDANHVCLNKIKDSNNVSYVDNFFYYLTTQLLNHHNFLHGVEYYGSFLGIQEKFKMNVSDDLEYLSDSSYFIENYNKLYTVTHPYMNEFVKNSTSSRANKNKIVISNSRNTSEVSIGALDICDNSGDSNGVLDELDLVYEKEINTVRNSVSGDDSSDSLDDDYVSSSECDDDDDDDVSSSECDDDDSGSECDHDDSGSECNDDDSGSECNDDSGSECNSSSKSNGDESSQSSGSGSCTDEEEIQYAYINNFPIQMICLEKCDGTLDELFEKDKIDEEEGMAILFQIIMTLLVYQKAFHFTHNDLHTNNIMYKNTTVEYLYYQYKKQVYRVPTYGKIYKIIDFGRAIYRYKNELFCSDSFANGGDASTQYNCEPYMDENKPRLEPNYSFDLCRLGCSIYDFIIEEEYDTKKFNELQKIIYNWCLDDNGKNVLYKKNGDERYPGFKLYKMIARTVHRHTPEQQLKNSYYNRYIHSHKGEHFINIDDFPTYVTGSD
jgi:hypothetical protein